MTGQKLYYWTGRELHILIVSEEYPNQYRVNQQDSKYVRHVNKARIDRVAGYKDDYYSFNPLNVLLEIARQRETKEKQLRDLTELMSLAGKVLNAELEEQRKAKG